MHDQVTVLIGTVALTTLTTGATTIWNVWSYKKQKQIDRGDVMSSERFDELEKKTNENSTDIKDIKATLAQTQKEYMAGLRVDIVRELKRCLKQKFRTQTDNETIEPLLDIYFDENHNGNGVVKQLTKAYHALPLETDEYLE